MLNSRVIYEVLNPVHKCTIRRQYNNTSDFFDVMEDQVDPFKHSGWSLTFQNSTIYAHVVFVFSMNSVQ